MMQANQQNQQNQQESLVALEPGLGAATYRLVEDLQGCGINVSEIKKLQDAGYMTVGSVLQSCSRDLIAIKGTIIN
jgi:hypothetical protein